MFLTLVSVIAVSFLVTFFSINKIIFISHRKNLFDEPGENRKIHTRNTPNLGGVGIFIAILLTSLLFLPGYRIEYVNYQLCGFFIIFLTGLTDDLISMRPSVKIFFQCAAVLLITIPGEIRFTDLHGFIGIYKLSYWPGVLLSSFFMLVLINAFNLIDGVNYLAGSLIFTTSLIFVFTFQQMNLKHLMIPALTVCGSLVAFFYFNRTPARIFLGDSGSLFLGLLMSYFSIQACNFIHKLPSQIPIADPSFAPVFILALFIIPFSDTMRVGLIRVFLKKSPFTADRNHIHHRLLDIGFNHAEITGILVSATLASIVIADLSQPFGVYLSLFLLASFSIFLFLLIEIIAVKSKKEKAAIIVQNIVRQAVNNTEKINGSDDMLIFINQNKRSGKHNEDADFSNQPYLNPGGKISETPIGA
jgi:UDP-N-acetylmuramyl pentapeptide phosphotransferase/UDP-N-acetylglucosamine-1-phosphate transferase